uniref:Zinc finger, CCHC-type n=1 Tax=Tanacetum cinerariifolium TaxID=118510 RepID=A0A6L2P3Y6_TANCI|nr:zinc finger, CCHC-type [Tanacetum cinerariifolium]
MKKKKNTAFGVIELNTILNRSWIYETGCGTHICNTMQGLRASRKLKPEALSLYVGNGQREAVEAIGAFYLCLPSGLEIALNDCHYAPKKRIKKLQHDGLLDSSDLRAFEKCVSCMTGKMARKPYTHQVERAKDLLGLIHTDSLWLCLLVEEFLDHLKDHGIIAHRTPPYTPQHNGVLERRNRTLLDMMTTSSTNNSVFKGFFEKQKLTRPNFIDWYRQLRIVLSIEDKLNYLEQPIPPALVAPAGQQVAPEILAAHSTWVKGSKEIAGLMLMTMEPEIQRNLEPLHAHEMLKELKTLFAQQAEQELLQTTRYFHSCRLEEGQSVSSYILKMKGYIDNLERLGHPVTLGLGTVNELHAMLKLHEQNLPKSNAPALNAIRAGKNKQAYAPKPEIPPPPKRKNPAKDSICHECGEIGYWKKNCPQYLAELMKKKKNTASRAGGSGSKG